MAIELIEIAATGVESSSTISTTDYLQQTTPSPTDHVIEIASFWLLHDYVISSSDMTVTLDDPAWTEFENAGPRQTIGYGLGLPYDDYYLTSRWFWRTHAAGTSANTPYGSTTSQLWRSRFWAYRNCSSDGPIDANVTSYSGTSAVTISFTAGASGYVTIQRDSSEAPQGQLADAGETVTRTRPAVFIEYDAIAFLITDVLAKGWVVGSVGW